MQVNKGNSFGPSFNANGGGWYAMERTSSFINIFFWERNDGSVPSDVKNGASSVNTGNWVRVLLFIDTDRQGVGIPLVLTSERSLAGHSGC